MPDNNKDPHQILEIVCDKFQVSMAELTTKATRRSCERVWIGKQVACYLIKKYTSLSNRRAFILFGYAEHSTVVTNAKTTKRIMDVDKGFRQQVENIEQCVIAM